MFSRWRGLAALAPFSTVLDDPIGEGFFKANIVAHLFGFNPLVLEDFVPLCLKFSVEVGISNKLVVTVTGA